MQWDLYQPQPRLYQRTLGRRFLWRWFGNFAGGIVVLLVTTWVFSSFLHVAPWSIGQVAAAYTDVSTTGQSGPSGDLWNDNPVVFGVSIKGAANKIYPFYGFLIKCNLPQPAGDCSLGTGTKVYSGGLQPSTDGSGNATVSFNAGNPAADQWYQWDVVDGNENCGSSCQSRVGAKFFYHNKQAANPGSPTTSSATGGSCAPAAPQGLGFKQDSNTVFWDATSGANKYSVRVVDSSAGNTQSNYDTPNAWYTLPANTLIAGHSYDWWVHAGNDCGFGTPTGSNFTIAQAPSCPLVTTPTSLTPNGETLPAGTGSVVLRWSEVTGATYEVGFKTKSGSIIYQNDNVTTSNAPVNLQSGIVDYDWWVYAKTSCGKSSPATATFSVTSSGQTPTPTPSPTSPTVGNASCSFSPTAPTIIPGAGVRFYASYNADSGGFTPDSGDSGSNDFTSAPYATDYFWTFGDGQSASSGTSPEVFHSYPNPGTFSVNLTVRDSAGRTPNCSGTVYVQNQGSGSLSCSISPQYPSGTAPYQITFYGYATPTSGRSITNYQWDWTNDGSFDASGQYTTTTTPPPYYNNATIRLYVTDSGGQNGTCSTSISVSQTNQPTQPSCTLSVSPNNTATGNQVTLTAFYNNGGNNNRYANSYNFYFGDGNSRNAGGSNSIQQSYQNSGTYYPSVTITDTFGSSVSCSSVVTVNPQSTGQLSCTIAAAPTSGSAPLPVSFSANTSVPTGRTISNYQWDWTNDGAYDSTAQSTAFTFQNAGTYTTKLQVTDTAGATALCFQTILVGQIVGVGGTPSLTLNKVAIVNNTEYDNVPTSVKRFDSGNTVNFRLKIANNSAIAAQNVIVTDDLPAWLDVASAGGGSVSGRRITWNLGTTGGNSSQNLDYTATVRSDLPAGETIQRNNANLTATNVPALTDSVSVVIFRQPTAGEPVLSVTKTPLSQDIGLGGTAGFTIRVRNNSGRGVGDVEVWDDLPNGFSYIGGSTTGSTRTDPTVNGSTLRWSKFSLDDNAEWSVSFRASGPMVAGTFTNQAWGRVEGKNFGPSQAFVFIAVPIQNRLIGVGGAAGGGAGPTVTKAYVGSATSLPKTGPEAILWAGIPTLFGVGWRLRHVGDTGQNSSIGYALALRRRRAKHGITLFQ